jgi:hypothetical protein
MFLGGGYEKESFRASRPGDLSVGCAGFFVRENSHKGNQVNEVHQLCISFSESLTIERES